MLGDNVIQHCPVIQQSASMVLYCIWEPVLAVCYIKRCYITTPYKYVEVVKKCVCFTLFAQFSTFDGIKCRNFPFSLNGSYYLLSFPNVKHTKGGYQSLFMYVNQPITWPPIDQVTLDFACRYVGIKRHLNNFQRSLFGLSFWHEDNLPNEMVSSVWSTFKHSKTFRT